MDKAVTDFKTCAKAYSECSQAELSVFEEMVLRGGEVRADTLQAGMARAQRLVFCTDGDLLVGVAAVKAPLDSYRKSTAAKSKLTLSAEDWPVEFGWCFVDEPMRGKGISYLLVECAVRELHTGIFATSRSQNYGMHKALEKSGFIQEGECYPSERQAAWMVVFRRKKP